MDLKALLSQTENKESFMQSNKVSTKNTENSNNNSKFKKFLYNVFVKNIGYKLVSLAIAIFIWILIVGLGF